MNPNEVQRLLLAAAVHDLAVQLRMAKLTKTIADAKARFDALQTEPLAPYVGKALQMLRDTDALINSETLPTDPPTG